MLEETVEKEGIIPGGSVLGRRYKIEQLIGRGGMAKVYSAYDQKLRIKIALKVLNLEHYQNTNFVKRFYREAQAAAMLNHKSIARVYDVNEIEGLHCISMEFVEGETLEKRMNSYLEQEKFFPTKEACSIIRNVLEALNYAHIQGIIHRDINPRNIIVSKDNSLKITDFGVAKIILPEESKPERPILTQLTQDFSFIGTPNYVSPEQINLKQVSGKTDIFSAGVILYEMITGRLPFNNVKETPFTTAITNIDREKLKSPRTINKRVPQKLEDILLKSLEKNPDKRYDAEGFYKDLDAYIKGETVRVEGSFKRRFEINRREFLVKGGLELVGVGLLIGTPTILIIKKNEYEKSLYSTLNKIQEAQTWEETKPFLKELKIKLFNWVLERSKYLKKDVAAFCFNENKTVTYINDSYQGFNFIGDISSLGFRETHNKKFLELFSHFYDLVKFYENTTYQYYLDRFKIDKNMFKLLEAVNFGRTDEFKSKMKSAIQHLVSERYNKTGKFFQYIKKNDEKSDEQTLYACTQYYTIPLLIEGFKIFNIRKEFEMNPAEYLNLIINQTRTSNKILLGNDYGIYFGAYFHILSTKAPSAFPKVNHSDKAYLSDDIIKYIEAGLYPVILLFDYLEKNRNIREFKETSEENVHKLDNSYLDMVRREKEELTTTLLKILGFYRENLKSDGSSPYYIPIEGKGFKENNPSSLPSTISYYNFIISK